jgi:hypothetical protein
MPALQSDEPAYEERWRTGTEEPSWSYDLHPKARELFREHGDVPLLAAAQLITAARDSGGYADGALIVGEAKSGREVRENETRSIKGGGEVS